MNAIRRHRNRTAARAPFARTLLVAFTVFAFVMQGLAIQTHIHPAGGTAWTFGFADKSPVAQPGKSGVPGQDDLTHCAFCDAVAHSGVYVSPAAPLLLPPTATFSIIPLEIVVPAYVDAASHFWHGRAPPRV